MEKLKTALTNVPALVSIDYTNGREIFVAVDASE
jgi:hypothetical protein